MRNYAVHTGLTGMVNMEKTHFEMMCALGLQAIGECALESLASALLPLGGSGVVAEEGRVATVEYYVTSVLGLGSQARIPFVSWRSTARIIHRPVNAKLTFGLQRRRICNLHMSFDAIYSTPL